MHISENVFVRWGGGGGGWRGRPWREKKMEEERKGWDNKKTWKFLVVPVFSQNRIYAQKSLVKKIDV